MEEITINGVVYEKDERRPQKKVSKFVSAAIVLSGFAPEVNNYSRGLHPDTDIVKEYELIQLKQSSLSRWERDAVVRVFERMYKVKT